jgi:hypothetical protein
MRETPLRQRYTATLRHLMRSRIDAALTSFGDRCCGRVAHLFACIGILDPPSVVGTRPPDELLEKTAAYGASGILGARTSVAGAARHGNPVAGRKMLLGLQLPRKTSTTSHASIGRARQGAGFHATFSLTAALCDAVWPN